MKHFVIILIAILFLAILIFTIFLLTPLFFFYDITSLIEKPVHQLDY